MFDRVVDCVQDAEPAVCSRRERARGRTQGESFESLHELVVVVVVGRVSFVSRAGGRGRAFDCRGGRVRVLVLVLVLVCSTFASIFRVCMGREGRAEGAVSLWWLLVNSSVKFLPGARVCGQ